MRNLCPLVLVFAILFLASAGSDAGLPPDNIRVVVSPESRSESWSGGGPSFRAAVVQWMAEAHHARVSDHDRRIASMSHVIAHIRRAAVARADVVVFSEGAGWMWATKSREAVRESGVAWPRPGFRLDPQTCNATDWHGSGSPLLAHACAAAHYGITVVGSVVDLVPRAPETCSGEAVDEYCIYNSQVSPPSLGCHPLPQAPACAKEVFHTLGAGGGWRREFFVVGILTFQWFAQFPTQFSGAQETIHVKI